MEESDLLDAMVMPVSKPSGETAADIRANIERLRRELQILRHRQCENAEQTIASTSLAPDVSEPEVPRLVKHTRYSIVRRNHTPNESSIVVKNVCHIYSKLRIFRMITQVHVFSKTTITGFN